MGYRLWRVLALATLRSSKIVSPNVTSSDKRHIVAFTNVEYQKRFDWLGRQSLDFYLPNYNVAVEYQGRQHFCDYSLFNHDEILKCDLKKLEKCKEHNIQIYYITFEEKCIPLDFQYYKIYINLEELIKNIKNGKRQVETE